MDRRDFMTLSSAGVAAVTLGRIGAAGAADTPTPPLLSNAPWRTFEVITDVELWPQDAPAKAVAPDTALSRHRVPAHPRHSLVG